MYGAFNEQSVLCRLSGKRSWQTHASRRGSFWYYGHDADVDATDIPEDVVEKLPVSTCWAEVAASMRGKIPFADWFHLYGYRRSIIDPAFIEEYLHACGIRG